jgi:hypothetical protein
MRLQTKRGVAVSYPWPCDAWILADPMPLHLSSLAPYSTGWWRAVTKATLLERR